METIVKYGYEPVKQYADKKGISVQAVYQAIKKGKLDSKKIGSMILVRE